MSDSGSGVYQPFKTGIDQPYKPLPGSEQVLADRMGSGVIDLMNQGRDPRGDGLTLQQFEAIAIATRQQPDWRTFADKCADYCDHNQTTPERAKELDDKGLPLIQKNLITPIVNLVLGIEAQNKRDARVEGDDDGVQDTAEGLSALLHQAERETHADRAISEAFAGQTKVGIHWVEVAEQSDPFKFWLRVSPVHRREIWWDWFSREYDTSDDGQFLVRRRWYPIAYLQAVFPQWAAVFEGIRNNWGRWWLQSVDKQPWLTDAKDQASRTSLSQMEWIDRTRSKICVYECWHKTWVRGWVARLANGSVIEFDPETALDDPLLVEALNSRQLRPEPATYARWRRSLWAGPYRLSETGKCPNKLPYVPFWGFREDLTGSPYGIVRSMISQQDEINARRQMLMWLLAAKRIEMDSDALDLNANTVEDMLDNINDPDAVVMLNPNNRQARFKVVQDLGLASQQFEILQDAQQGLQDVAGVYRQMLGDGGGVTAGVALNQLINQGVTGLADLFDNYSSSRQMVFGRMLDCVLRRIQGQRTEVVVGEFGGKRTIIVLNDPQQHPQTGEMVVANDTSAVTYKVALEDTPSTPTYRQQLMTTLGEVLKSLPEQMQALLVPYYLELSDIPKRHEMAKLIRKQLGLLGEDEAEADPEKAELRQKLEQAMQLIQQLQAAPEAKLKEAQAAKALADAAKAKADAHKTIAETVRMIHPEPEPGETAAHERAETPEEEWREHQPGGDEYVG